MSRFIQSRAELEAIETIEACAHDEYKRSVRAKRANGFLHDAWRVWESLADRARADYYRSD